MVMGNLCHVFTEIVFVPLKHGVALDLSRNHYQETQERVRSAESLSFTCQCCSASAISTEREFFLSTFEKTRDCHLCF